MAVKKPINRPVAKDLKKVNPQAGLQLDRRSAFVSSPEGLAIAAVGVV